MRKSLLVVYHCLPILRNILARATFEQQQPSYNGNSQGHQARCVMYEMVDKFKSLITWKTYQVKAKANGMKLLT